MKRVLLVAAVLVVVLISGCTVLSTEEGRAIALAAQTTEGQIMIKMADALSRFQYCTTQDMIAAVAMLPDAPQLTQEQLQQLEAQMIEMKKCIPSMDIQARDMENGIYNVEYTSILPETCADSQTQNQPLIIVEANLNDDSTKVIKGGMPTDPAQIQTAFAQMDMLGDCAALGFIGFTSQTMGSFQTVKQETR
jgi:hypothetical protein